MATSVLSIGTAVPPTRLAQQDVRDLFIAQPGASRLTQRLIGAAFDASGIESRHTVLAEFSGEVPETPSGIPVIDESGRILSPSTGARNAEYIRQAPPLFAAAADAAIRGAGIAPDQVTHVVTVSCTGMFAPGPDYRLVRDLGLPVTVERYHLGFVGCAAALPGLRTAARICAGDPDAVVLVVCAELCTLHFRVSEDPQQIVSSSVFADGAAAAIVSADPSLRGAQWLELERFATAVTDDGEHDMAWTVGDEGFEMVLSAEVPRIIGREIRGAVARFLGDDDVDAWAVHPGGRSVLDRVESGLELPASTLEVSRRILRDYGNMSSATILFILREFLNGTGTGTTPDARRIATLAFGPGLTVESALVTRRTAEAPDAPETP
ncbi:type III polyketide synthase [Microbacterium sp. zg-Y818]|uniref:type III polyketide synthase n=1 Tax=unclassified Microbacterium TaxID=2609290 RepID=UPI00214AD411|nr:MULTISPECIES: type III polyketide synthase [unclassified Microbacterium]MCR2800338.1 type III polyketide synthase [Microbacterium sp. zg.Y818]WIM22299.1 type III polyketide synthase [Microbacterium sp. zg-Y818]